MNILITGGTGFIGSHLVERLHHDGHTLTLLVRKTSDFFRIQHLITKIKTVTYSNPEEIEKIFKNDLIDGVIHLATHYIRSQENIHDINEMIATNIKLPSVILKHAIQHNVVFFINTGTCFEYPSSKNAIHEETPLNPFNFYACTKISFEQILRYYTSQCAFRAVTLKLFHPYGEKDNEKLMPSLIKSFINNKKLQLTPGEQQLSYTYIDDIINAYIQAIRVVTTEQELPYQVFNIGSEQYYSIRAIVKILEKISHKKAPISFGRDYAPNEIMSMKCDNSKAQKILLWKPEYSLEEGLYKMYNYYSNLK